MGEEESDLLGLEPEQNKEELLHREIRDRHGESSLIVLETLNRYLEHGITPSVHRKKMFDAYITSKKKKGRKEKLKRSSG